jgi:hypothetical protein
MPNPARQIWPHLQSGERPKIKQRTPSLADALFPSLSKEAKAKERDQALWDAICQRNREILRKNLREASGRGR